MRAGLVLALVLGSAAAARFAGAPLSAFAPARAPGPSSAPAPAGTEIVACGQRFPVGTAVVLWTDPDGYDATLRRRRDRPELVLPARPAPGCDTPERVGKRPGVETLADLRRAVDLFVVHYDQSWTSRNCFHVLHDVRGLSVHFLLDLDGTIYQTCDLVERCRHAREANDRSIGVEVAHPGALEDDPEVAARYRRDASGRPFLALPPWLGPRPLRTAGFVPRPARSEPVRGAIHGRPRTQWDFTAEQYEALGRLIAACARIFPRLPIEAPRDPATGRVLDRTLAAGGLDPAAFRGIVGHYHLTEDKTDPGPAFDWERALAAARAALTAPAASAAPEFRPDAAPSPAR